MLILCLLALLGPMLAFCAGFEHSDAIADLKAELSFWDRI